MDNVEVEQVDLYKPPSYNRIRQVRGGLIKLVD
jgi:hypothetical protein